MNVVQVKVNDLVFVVVAIVVLRFMARGAGRAPLSFYLFMFVAGVASLLPAAASLYGADDRSVIRLIGISVVVSGLFWAVWDFDEKYK